MDIAQLQYFRIVATLQQVTKAAEELNISQSALSQSITRLEEELGVELFERYGRCIRLNEYGKAFLPEVEQTLASLEKGRRLLKGMQAQSGNSVVIIASALLGFPNLIPHICSDCESVNISTFNCPVDRVVSKLKTGEADFCLMPVRFEDPSLDHHLLRLCEQGVLVVDTHPLSGEKSVC
jgi:DNA-binding transcriptional LysR family regulator